MIIGSSHSWLNCKLRKKPKTTAISSSENRYSAIIADLVRIRDRGPTSQKFDPGQYKKELRLSSRFRLATLPNGTLRLRDSNGKDFMKNEEIFSNLWDCHKELMHGSREPMERRMKNYFANVPRDAISDFTKLCQECEKKRNNRHKHLVVQPIVSNHFNKSGTGWLD